MPSHSIERHPFKCPSCGAHYSTKFDCDANPVHLSASGCSHTMCVKCARYKRYENEKSTNLRRSLLLECSTCSRISFVKEQPVRALALMDIIKEIEAKKTSKALLEASDLDALKCVCSKYTFSSNSESDQSPYVLVCGHSLCVGCLEVNKKERSAEDRDSQSPQNMFSITCLVDKTHHDTLFNTSRGDGGAITDVVRWLEKSKEEYVESLMNNNVSCANCAKLNNLLEKMYQDGKSKTDICVPDVDRVAEKFSELVTKVNECLASAAATIPNVLEFSDRMKIVVQLAQKWEEYNCVLGTIVPTARMHNKMLEEFIATLEETFPKIVAESGRDEEETKRKSEGEEETQNNTDDESEEDERDAETCPVESEIHLEEEEKEGAESAGDVYFVALYRVFQKIKASFFEHFF